MWDEAECILCGDCLVKCQYIDYDEDKAIREIEALMEGREAEILNKCVTCLACQEYCPTGADPSNLIITAMEKEGISPRSDEEYKEMVSTSFNEPGEMIPGEPDKPVLSLCSGVARRSTHDGILNGQLFKGLTIVRGGDYVCSIRYAHYGKESPIEQSAQPFIDNLASLGKELVFLHDGCYSQVHAKMKDYGIAVPFKYRHVFEYLRDYFHEHQNSITKLNRKVAYHRPCASRYTPEKDTFLDEIFELIGVERPPRKYDRETSLCCMVPILNSDTDRAIMFQEMNLKDAIDCGADALITFCPGCDRTLRSPCEQFGLTKIFVTDLCRMALGEIPWPA